MKKPLFEKEDIKIPLITFSLIFNYSDLKLLTGFAKAALTAL